MMDRILARNMWSFIPKINLRNYCILLVLLQEYITMHDPLNVKFFLPFNTMNNGSKEVKAIRHQ